MSVGLAIKKDSVWKTWDSPELQNLFAQGESTTDQDMCKAIYLQMQKLMQDDLPCIPLWQVYNFTAVSTRVTVYVARPSESIIVRGVQVRQ
jgi:ABC-type transport system substrate-binding protein